MRFTVLALNAVPDTDTARRIHQLQDLDDRAVAKILFHRRKQQTGNSEQLRLVQQRIASLSLLSHAAGKVVLKTCTVPESAEADVLASCIRSIKNGGRLVTWGGRQGAIPLLRLRCLHHELRARALWRPLVETVDASHLDLQQALQAPGETAAVDLNELALLFGLPGMLESAAPDPWALRLAGDYQALRAATECEALNLYLLALRYWQTSGSVPRRDGQRSREALRAYLGAQVAPHLQRFLQAWGTAT
jgi:predicted PolB exonuclease-like 3'-5' exonuclease